jgi:hypothetical protein
MDRVRGTAKTAPFPLSSTLAQAPPLTKHTPLRLAPPLLPPDYRPSAARVTHGRTRRQCD